MKSDKIRRSAKGKECTLRIPGVCNFDPETTVLAHLDDESKGMAIKSDDFCSCYACSSCHDFIDGRDHRVLSLSESDKLDIEIIKRRAMTRTLRSLFDEGVILVS